MPLRVPFGALLLVAAAGTLALGATAVRFLTPWQDPLLLGTSALFTEWCLRFLGGAPQLDEFVAGTLLGLTVYSSAAVSFSTLRYVRRAPLPKRLLVMEAAAWPSELTQTVRDLGLERQVRLVLTDIPLAVCHGLLRPQVALSTALVAMLTPQEMEAVLIHERHHLRQWDPLKLVVGRAVCRAFFYLPLVTELLRHYALMKELQADAAVIREQAGKQWLARALHRMSVGMSGSVSANATGASFSAELDARIIHLTTGQMPRLRPSFLRVVGTLVVFAALAVLLLAPQVTGLGVHLHAVADELSSHCNL